MPVAEYKMHKQGNGRIVPDFIKDGGHWYNPDDHTFIGWIPENPDYYVPDTLVYLTKEQFLERVTVMHNARPLTTENDEIPGIGAPLSSDELSNISSDWYDNFVLRNNE
jgi:hypothetical protein